VKKGPDQSTGYGVAGEDVELLYYIMSESIGCALEMVIKGLIEVRGCVDEENEWIAVFFDFSESISSFRIKNTNRDGVATISESAVLAMAKR
jgi:hypothetical protein